VAGQGAYDQGVASSPAGPVARRIFLAGIAAQVAIVVTGGLVRLTGSGLGCPTWPECAPGSYVPVAQQAEGYQAVIEFGNRLLTFFVGLVIVAGIIAALRVRPFRRSLLILASVQLLGVVGQAILGGITVLTNLHPASVASHFLLSGLLIAAATLLYERSGEGDGPPQPLVGSEVRWLSRALLAVTAAVVVVGTVVTGSGPHAGDVDARRFGVDPRTVSWLHADLVFLFLGLVIAMIVVLRVIDGPERARRRAVAVLAVVLAQGTVGYVQYFTGLPALVVAVHLLGASVVIIAVVRLHLSLRTRPRVGAAGPAEPKASSTSGAAELGAGHADPLVRAGTDPRAELA
jgi:cytochrome c oxidase assembly protein subunit 15